MIEISMGRHLIRELNTYSVWRTYRNVSSEELTSLEIDQYTSFQYIGEYFLKFDIDISNNKKNVLLGGYLKESPHLNRIGTKDYLRHKRRAAVVSKHGEEYSQRHGY